MRAKLFVPLFVGILSVGLFGFAFAAPPDRVVGGPAKVHVCHWDDEVQAHYLISVSEKGYAHGHMAHDDDFLFESVGDCAPEPEEVPEPELQISSTGGGFD